MPLRSATMAAHGAGMGCQLRSGSRAPSIETSLSPSMAGWPCAGPSAGSRSCMPSRPGRPARRRGAARPAPADGKRRASDSGRRNIGMVRVSGVDASRVLASILKEDSGPCHRTVSAMAAGIAVASQPKARRRGGEIALARFRGCAYYIARHISPSITVPSTGIGAPMKLRCHHPWPPACAPPPTPLACRPRKCRLPWRPTSPRP